MLLVVLLVMSRRTFLFDGIFFFYCSQFFCFNGATMGDFLFNKAIVELRCDGRVSRSRGMRSRELSWDA
jgi:hypothetical protein